MTIKLIEGLKRLNVPYRNLDLYVEAFMHKTYINEKHYAGNDMQRLEFFGDAVISFLVAKYLLNKYPDYQEGKLTQIRLNIVEEKSLAGFARKLKLGELLYLGKGAEKAGFRQLDSLLCDVFESFIGALYLDLGDQFAQTYLYTLIKDEVVDVRDPKSQLQELMQTEARLVEYALIDQVGPTNDRTFTCQVLIDNVVYGTGQGRSKKMAEKNAASDALSKLA